MGSLIKTIIVSRLSEPSTYLGIIAVATAFGLHLTQVQIDALVTMGIAVFGGVNIVTPDSMFSKFTNKFNKS